MRKTGAILHLIGEAKLSGLTRPLNRRRARPEPPVYLLRPPPERDEPPDRDPEDLGDYLTPEREDERVAIDRDEPDRAVPYAVREPAEFDDDLMARVNAPGNEGPRLMTLPGEVFTELDAIAMLTGASATVLAAGGVYGAEGAIWLGIEGSPQQVQAAGELIQSLANEPPCAA